MPFNSEIASAIREQLEDKFGQLDLQIECSSYSEQFNKGRTFQRACIHSYVFYNDEDGRRIRIDILQDGSIYQPGCGGSSREMTKIAKAVTL